MDTQFKWLNLKSISIFVEISIIEIVCLELKIIELIRYHVRSKIESFFLAPLNYFWLLFCKQKEKYLLSIWRNILSIIIFLAPFFSAILCAHFRWGSEFLFKLLPHFLSEKMSWVGSEWRERKANRFIGVLYALWSLYHFEMVMGLQKR